MTQLELTMPPRSHLSRVRSAIAAPIVAFCADRLRAGKPEFHMSELVEWIGSEAAPDSPSRILRDLRARGVVSYELVSRRQSLYRVTGVKP